MNQYTQVGAHTYDYDANGNMVAAHESMVDYPDIPDESQYVFDAFGRMVRSSRTIEELPYPTVFYRYDAEGRRTSRRYWGHRYSPGDMWVGWEITTYQYREHDVASEQHTWRLTSRDRDYLLGDEIDTAYGYRDRLRGEYRFYLKDQFNTVLGVADEDGEPMEFYSYGPYGDVAIFSEEGVPRSVSSYDVENARFFQSRELDEESGLYYFRARYYKPSLGRFISVDPAQFDSLHNPYTFVENNPATMNDPMGTFAFSPTFRHCSMSKEAWLKFDDDYARDIVQAGRSYTDVSAYEYTHCADKNNFRRMFGCQGSTKNRHQFRKVRTVFRRADRDFDHLRRYYECESSGSFAAWVRYPSKWVHINPPYWQSDAKYWYDYSDQVMRATTLTHEYMHLNGTHTDPEVYGHKNCLDLAKSNPKKAGENAESHAYFAVEQKYFKPTVDRLAAESYVNPSVPGSAQHDFDTDPALGAIQ